MSLPREDIRALVAGLDADARTAVLQAMGALEEEVGMLEFRLKRMEKIKRTTAVFLDESVAELEQKRKTVEEINARLEESLRELKAAQEQLIQQEKLASLGQMTAGIAHEIKNPLNFVNNFAEVNLELLGELEEELAAAGLADRFRDLLDDLRTNSEAVRKHGKRADSIVRTMMQHASGGAGEKVATDVNALVAEHIDLAYHGRRAHAKSFQVSIVRDFAAETGSVDLVPQAIGRVLLNLLGNAFDALMEHAARTGPGFEPEVRVATLRTASHVEIRVVDNGPGIPEEIRAKIFEPFFTTKPTGAGTGLGLSLSYDIVTQGHGGSMTVESEPGSGAAFTVRLPAA